MTNRSKRRKKKKAKASDSVLDTFIKFVGLMSFTIVAIWLYANADTIYQGSSSRALSAPKLTIHFPATSHNVSGSSSTASASASVPISINPSIDGNGEPSSTSSGSSSSSSAAAAASISTNSSITSTKNPDFFWRFLNKKVEESVCLPSIDLNPVYKGPYVSRLGLKPNPSSNIKIIVAGRGTTGTTEIYHKFCQNRVHSTHWSLQCGLDRQSSALVNTLRQLYNDAKCCSFGGQYVGKCFRTNMPRAKGCSSCVNCKSQNWINKFKQTLSKLVNEGNLHAMIDAPYPSYFQELIAMVPNARVLLTMRNATEWGKRRVEVHGVDPFVKGRTEDDFSDFDVVGCALRSKELYDCLIPQAHVKDAQKMAASFIEYNRLVQQFTPPDNIIRTCAWDNMENHTQTDQALLHAVEYYSPGILQKFQKRR